MTLRRYAIALVATLGFVCYVQAGEGDFDRDGSYRTANFRTTAATKDLAARFGDAAEQYRRDKARDWLGQEMPNWPNRCPLRIEINMKQSGGATTFSFGGDGGGKSGVSSQEMKIWGDAQQLLHSVLPHEVTHTVLAYHFGKPVPRWADEGSSVLSENDEECYQHDIRCRELLNQGRGMCLTHLFRQTEYPKDMIVIYAQGYSISQYLIQRGGRAKFLEFVGLGMKNRNGNWEAAVREVYQMKSVDDLEQTWIDSLRSAPQRINSRTKGDVIASRGNRSDVRSSGLPGTPLLADPVVSRGAAPEREPSARLAARTSAPVTAAAPKSLLLPPEPPSPPRKAN